MRASLVSRGVRVQFAVGIALISVIPLLALWYLGLLGETGDETFIKSLWVVLPVLVASGAGGVAILRKYPINIVRLRGYLENMIRGELPEHVKLLKAEDDLAAVENCLNLIVAQLRERLEALKKEKKSLQEQLYQTQKMESLGLMAAGVAHDFNNLLMGLMGHADLLSAHVPEGAAGADNLEAIGELLGQACDLTRQMLVYAGKARFAMAPLDVSDLIRGMDQFMRTAAGRTIRLTCNLADGLPRVLGDKAQVSQVVMNLVMNASEAIGGRNGDITVSARAVETAGLDLTGATIGGTMPQGKAVCIEVTDTGSGMETERQARIFDPFFSTKPKGRGLGLAVTLGIVVGHKGAIAVNSEAGKGTRMQVFIPCA